MAGDRADVQERMQVSAPPVNLVTWGLAVLPIVVLLVLVVRGRLTPPTAASVVLAVAVLIAATIYRAGAPVLAVSLAKGLWLGLWISLVVWPALLLYQLADAAGLEKIGAVFTSLLPRRRENLLLVAWLFPSFIQGVAGFGTPIAVAAPLLVAMGYPTTRAVVYPLIGYHWAVTFGSMGSSFYMAALTARLETGQQEVFAAAASLFLAVNCLLAAALVLWIDGGLPALREGRRVLLAVGIPMALTLTVTARAVPAVATLAAGTVGFAAMFALRRLDRPQRLLARQNAGPGGSVAAVAAPDDPSPIALLSPYLYLLATALPVFLWPASRTWVKDHLVIAPWFPETVTGFGVVTPAGAVSSPLALLGHPGFYILLACLFGYITYRNTGLLDGGQRAIIANWARKLPSASLPILALACVAAVFLDSGMVTVLAQGTAAATRGAFPVLSPLIGAIGSFLTGSTTSSNALFSVLQSDIAALLAIDPTVLLAAQTAGGNVGNAVAPVVIVIGSAAIGRIDQTSDVLRAALAPAAVLLATVTLMTLIATAIR